MSSLAKFCEYKDDTQRILPMVIIIILEKYSHPFARVSSNIDAKTLDSDLVTQNLTISLVDFSISSFSGRNAIVKYHFPCEVETMRHFLYDPRKEGVS